MSQSSRKQNKSCSGPDPKTGHGGLTSTFESKSIIKGGITRQPLPLTDADFVLQFSPVDDAKQRCSAESCVGFAA